MLSEPVDKLEVAEFLHAEHRLKGNVVEFEIDELEFFIVFKGPGYAADVFISRDNGRYSIAETTTSAMAVLNDPHKGRDSGKAWLWLIDISAVVMLLMSISRFGLLLYIKKRRNPGLLAAFSGTVALVVFWWVWVPWTRKRFHLSSQAAEVVASRDMAPENPTRKRGTARYPWRVTRLHVVFPRYELCHPRECPNLLTLCGNKLHAWLLISRLNLAVLARENCFRDSILNRRFCSCFALPLSLKFLGSRYSMNGPSCALQRCSVVDPHRRIELSTQVTRNHRRRVKMDTQVVIAHLNEILKHEWTGVAQYSQASFIVEGIWREVFAEKFEGDAKESFGHAKLIGDKIVALGGVPVAQRNEIKQSRDLSEVLQFSLDFESKAVEMYTEALRLAEGNRPLEVFLEDILLSEQEGVEEYTKLLRDTKAAADSSTARIAESA